MENPYETEMQLQEYLLFHYGHPEDVLPWKFGPVNALQYPVRCVVECFELDDLDASCRALDVGCAVGRSTLELGLICGEAIGIDYSRTFINAARALLEQGEMTYRFRIEGHRTGEAIARLPEDLEPARIRFEQGDAMHLRADLGAFDAVLAANLICRLTEPRKFLSRCRELVKPGGQLVINTPFTWLEDFTPPETWIGGRADTGESLVELVNLLKEDFELEQTLDMPFLIREHRRKYQWSVAQSCRFRRK